jgi:hypothetical protein
MKRTVLAMVSALSLVVGMSGCVVYDRDWHGRRYGRERYDHDRWDRDRWDDRYSDRDCWRQGRDWVCRR